MCPVGGFILISKRLPSPKGLEKHLLGEHMIEILLGEIKIVKG